MMRLGFSVRVLARPDLPSHCPHARGADHLSIGLAYLRDILLYLHDHDIHMYRMHCNLALGASGSLTEYMRQLAQWDYELAAVGALAAQCDARLSFHPYSAVVLNATNEDQAERAAERLTMQAAMLDAMGLGAEAVIVLHVGGVYGNLVTSRERFVRRFEALPSQVRRRLVLENDDHRFSHYDTLLIHRACGIPLVLDTLHHLVRNPERISMQEALDACLGSWPSDTTPKVHLASPRTEMRVLEGSRVKAPSWTEHSDFLNPFEVIDFMDLGAGARDFDIMLEAKARDLALLKLREDLHRFAPAFAERLR